MFYVHLSSQQHPQVIVESIKFQRQPSDYTVGTLKKQVGDYLQQARDDGNKVYVLGQVWQPSSSDQVLEESATLTLLPEEDFFITVDVKVDPARQVKAVGLSTDEKLKFKSLTKYNYNEAGQYVKVNLTELVLPENPSNVTVSFDTRSLQVKIHNHAGNNY